jgi:uncharacterized membrane protein
MMASVSTDALVAQYLRRLDRALGDVPRAGRRELIEEIRAHIDESRSLLETENEAAIRSLLDRVGDPEDIAADARERFGVRPPKRGALEVFALTFLLMGGLIIPLFGWFIGVGLLWMSEAWTTKDKLIGTFLLPGGLALGAFGLVFAVPSWVIGLPGAVEGLIVTAVLLTPIGTTIYLASRLRRRKRPR